MKSESAQRRAVDLSGAEAGAIGGFGAAIVASLKVVENYAIAKRGK